MSSVRSFGYFLHKLRSIETIKLDVFKELFASYRNYLAAGLGYFRPKRSAQNAKDDLIKEFEVDDSMADFVVDISEFLDLDHRQSYDLFCAYLLYDYAGPVRDTKALIDDVANRKILILEIENFHHREQNALLLSIIEILKIVQRSQDQLPHTAILESFVSEKLATPAFVDALLKSMKAIWTKEIEEKRFANGLRLDIANMVLHLYSLQENAVRLLIWLFYVSELPVDCDVAVLKFFAEQNFGKKQFYKKALPAYESNASIDRIFQLQILFGLRSFHLEYLLSIYGDETREKDSFWLNDASGKRLASIWDTNISPISHDHAGLALAYTLNSQLRRSIKANDEIAMENSAALDASIQKFGSIAKRNQCLKFCSQFLASPGIVDDQDTRSLARAIIYIALDGCLQFFEAGSIGSPDDLASLFCDILQDASVADAFWARGFTNGAPNYVLNSIVYQFYASFERPLLLLRSLAKSSTESCRKVVTLFSKLPVFTEPAANVDPQELAAVGEVEDMQDENTDAQNVVLLKQRQPLGTGGPTLPAGTRGRVIYGADECVQWEFSYNAWQICLLEVTSSSTNPLRIAPIFSLIGDIIKIDPNAAPLFVHFLKEAVAILRRTRYFETELWITLLQPCLSCLTAAAKTFPLEVATQIGNDDIIPSSKQISQREFSPSLVSRILNDVERLSGLYDCTIEFLDLVEILCNEASCYGLPAFSGSIVYICDSIFADYITWPYESIKQRNQIAMRCLKICRKILEKRIAASEGSGASINDVVNICRDALTKGEARRILLKLICTGVESLKDPYDVAENRISQVDIVDTVSLALALLLELLIDFESSKKAGSPPQIFVDLFASTSGADAALCIIGRYLLLKTDDRIPKLAIICLKKIAKIFPATMLSTLGEWTSAFCDALLARLESPAEDAILKIHCLEFLNATIRYQPGLAEKLLGVSSEEIPSKESTTDKPAKSSGDIGALACILNLIRTDRLLPDLASACMNVLATIWRTNTTTAMDYLRKVKKDEFWPALLAPLSAGEDTYFLTIVSPIFRILTRELYATGFNDTSVKSKASGDGSVIATVVKEFMESQRLKLTFKKLHEYCGSRIDSAEKMDVLGAWTDFLQTIFMDKNATGLLTDDIKRDILFGSSRLLNTTMNDAEQPGGLGVVKIAADLCGLALKYCLRNEVPRSERGSIMKEFESTLYRLNDANVEEWCMQLSAIVLPACSPVFRPSKWNKEENDLLPIMFDTLCSISVKILLQTAILHSRSLLGSSTHPWKKALHASLRCLANLYVPLAAIHEARALEILQKHSILRNLRVLMEALLSVGQFDVGLFTSVCLLFELAARSSEYLAMVQHSGFLEWICVDLANAKAVISDSDILAALFTLHISMLEAGAHRAASTCMTFVASYSDAISQLLFSFTARPTAKEAKTVSKALQLSILLADYKERWQFEASKSLELMLNAISALCQRIPPYLSKPAVLAEVISKQDPGQTNVGSGSGSTVDPRLAFLQQQLIEIMFFGIQFVLRFSPELMEVCNNPTFDVEAFRPLLVLDLNTNLTPEFAIRPEDAPSSSTLTFGAILLVVHLCVNSLRKTETSKSASPSAHRGSAPPLFNAVGDKTIVSSLLDAALYLLLSQASLIIRRNGEMDAWQRVLLKRDLAAELSQYLSRCGIRMSSGSSPSTPRKSPTPVPSATSPGTAIRSTTVGFDYQFLKFAGDFVRDVLRNND